MHASPDDDEAAVSEQGAPKDHYTTLEAARLLGLAVRSVQLMVDRGELEAWKTSGGHRRISRSSVSHWLASRESQESPVAARSLPERAGRPGTAPRAPRVLLIEDSVHYQNLISLLVKQRFPGVDLHVVGDGIAGLVAYGELRPDVLIVDILLPGIDGAALVSSLRSQARFADSALIVVTSLDDDQRRPYAFALEGVQVVHKSAIARDLPARLATALASAGVAMQP